MARNSRNEDLDLEDEDLPDTLPDGDADEESSPADEDSSRDAENDDEDEDARPNAEDGADDDDSGDAEDEDAEREAIRARRREERRLKKQHAKEREDTLKRELEIRDRVINSLNERLNNIDRRNNGFDSAQIDNQLRQLDGAYAAERKRLQDGAASGDGEAVADSTERMLQIREQFQKLANVKKAYAQNQNQPQPLDPRLASYAEEWKKNNRWYDPSGKDMDSRIVLLIDDQLAKDGFDPTTSDYWSELTNRVKKHLPGRYSAPIIPSNGKGKPVAPSRSPIGGSSRDGGGSGSRPAGYTLSPERVQALKDSGLWDDADKRKAAIKSFKEYDRAHKGDE